MFPFKCGISLLNLHFISCNTIIGASQPEQYNQVDGEICSVYICVSFHIFYLNEQ